MRDGVFGVFDAVRGAVGIEDTGVEDAVEFERYVVGCDGGLGGDFEGGFFERLYVGYALWVNSVSMSSANVNGDGCDGLIAPSMCLQRLLREQPWGRTDLSRMVVCILQLGKTYINQRNQDRQTWI